MKWYYKIGGNHTHVRVYMNGALCGNLTFTNEEFAVVRLQLKHDVEFFAE